MRLPGWTAHQPIEDTASAAGVFLSWVLHAFAAVLPSAEGVGGLTVKNAVPSGSALAPAMYRRLPLGSVKASGWMLDQIKLQNRAQAGKLQEFYPLVKDGTWIGGNVTYSKLQEALVYHLNAAVAGAAVSDDSELLAWVKTVIDYTVQHQSEDGAFGPDPQWQWARWLYLLGAVQYAELHANDSSVTGPVIDSIYKWVDWAHGKLQSTDYDSNTGGGTGIESWGAVRTQEYQYTLQNLYEHWPRGADTQAQLLADMKRVKEVGDLTYSEVPPWEVFFTDEVFPKDGYPKQSQRAHGVNLAMALKGAAVNWRLTQSQDDLTSHAQRWNITFVYHGTPAGTFNADEHLGGTDPWRGAETCLVAESMFSAAISYHILGRNEEADRAERLAFNALPGSTTGDFWQHQYLQQNVQIFVGNMTRNPFESDGPYSNVMGLESNYPCCTVNHGSGYPKWVANSWAQTWDQSSLLHMFLGPSRVATTVNGGRVAITAETDYPFDHTIRYEVEAEKPFDLLVRVPSWTDVSSSTYTVGDSSTRPVKPDEHSRQRITLPEGRSTVTVMLPQTMSVVDGPNGGKTLHRGPLHYVLDVPWQSSVLNDWPQYDRPEVRDLELRPTAPWAYAVDFSSLRFHDAGLARGQLPSPVFDAGRSPYSFTATACPVDWANDRGQWVTEAQPASAKCIGSNVTVTLAPYAAAKLRVGELPQMIPREE